MRRQAFESEASGYFLVPEEIPLAKGWRVVDIVEAAKVWGRGNTSSTQAGSPGDPLANKRKAKPIC